MDIFVHYTISRIMRIYLNTCVTACSALLLALTTSCNSSEQLLSPTTYYGTKKQGNITFIEDVAIKPGGGRSKLETVAGGSEIDATQAINNVMLSKYASMLGLIPEKMSNHILYEFIEEWYGVKYRYGGTNKSGIDCSAFAQKLYDQVFGTDLVRTARDQFHSCLMVWDTDNLKEGDLVFFKTRGRRISHVGVYLANNFFVHASSSQGVMISNLADNYWSTKFAGAGKIQKEKKDML